MKKILFIDPFSSDGHVNFNQIFIKELLKEEVTVDFIFKKGYNKKIKMPKLNLIDTFPDSFFNEQKNIIANKLNEIKKMNYVNKIINLSNYDLIILSSYDTVALYLSSIKKKLFLINHNNLQGLNNCMKFFFFKKISKTHNHIVFENYMKNYLRSIGVKNVFKISHGLPNKINPTFNINYLEKIKRNNFKKFIFVPSSSSSDTDFIQQTILDADFNNFLKSNHTLLIIKGSYVLNSSANVLVLNNHLPESEYNFYFIKSDIILIPYKRTFTKRVSAVMYECISNNKPFICSDIEAFRVYEDLIKYKPYFNSIDDLKTRILDLYNYDLKENFFYKNIRLILKPNFKLILK